MKNTDLKAWVKRRGLSHAQAADELALSVDALRGAMYRPDREVTRQTARIVELLEKICNETHFSH